MSILNMITSAVSNNMSKIAIAATKNSPTILLVTGIGCIIGGTVTAIMSTSKADDALDEFNKNIDRIHELVDKANATGDPEAFYPIETQKQNYKTVYGHMIMTMARIYLPTIILETVGICLICKSHSILSKRNAGLAAAYAALQNAFNEYRKRVKERYGEDAERDIYYGTHTVEYVEKETSENGVTKEVTKQIEKSELLNPFGFLISRDNNPGGYKDPNVILDDIQMRLNKLNSVLSARRSIRGIPSMDMNEIAEEFGEKRRKGWYGWIIRQNNKTAANNVINLGFDIQRDIKIEGSDVWKFAHGITDGIWCVPNIECHISDDLDYQYEVAGLKRALKGESNGGKVLLQS